MFIYDYILLVKPALVLSKQVLLYDKLCSIVTYTGACFSGSHLGFTINFVQIVVDSFIFLLEERAQICFFSNFDCTIVAFLTEIFVHIYLFRCWGPGSLSLLIYEW